MAKNKSDFDDIISLSLKRMKKVVVKRKLNSINFTIGKKVFAFTKGGSMVLKLPADKIRSLVQAKLAVILVMGGRKMREWVVVQPSKLGGSNQTPDLLKESMDFVIEISESG